MPDSRDYRDTVFLPKTDFPMKAGLPQKEPGILARWQADDLYRQVREARAGREKFILHDGPPYANGDMHIGHALNHVLKDMVVRTQTLLGKDAPYVPGWDCHGLPIEWKVEEEYRKKKLNKDEVDPVEFRAECRAYAARWVDVQREQLKRLGVNGDWDNPYLTMDFAAEATIVSELLKFAESGQLYRGAKPVMWSPVEKTALAEAEVEYEDITSTQIDVAFEIVESPIAELVGAHAVIWTTTPWTIPANQAIGYGPEVEYVLLSAAVHIEGTATHGIRPTEGWDDPSLNVLRSKRILVAAPLVEQFCARFVATTANVLRTYRQRGVPVWEELWRGEGSKLVGTFAAHPIYNFLRHSGGGRNPSLDTSGGLGGEMDPDLRRGDEEGGGGLGGEMDPGLRRGDEMRGVGPGGEMDPGLRRGDEEAGGGLGADDEEWERRLEFYARPRPFLAGEFVTTESGTGLVHLAPDHGEDDFELCRAHGILPQFVVEADGRYRENWPWLPRSDPRSMSVINPKFNAPGGPVCEDLRAAGALLSASTDYRHSYPHSWRSKAKVIFRCTPQWFVPMDKELPSRLREGSGVGLSGPGAEITGPPLAPPASGRGTTLRQTALAALDSTRFVPAKGRNRIGSMVEGRPDWVLSRQRAWGVPITLFVHRETGEYLVDAAVNRRIVEAVRAGGVDAWSEDNAQALLGSDYDAADYERIGDILDVWFDSGCTHAFVLESGRWPELQWPADLYLEGSDQHRGWFQSSLLESCGTRGRAPYKAVLTHGFTMASDGRKMSKSLGNTIDPNKVMEEYGADIIRLWALSVDYTEDHRIGPEILKGVADQYRKLRNTFRYLLGALDGFSENERVSVDQMPELERYVLSLLAQLDGELRRAVGDFDFNAYTRALVDFCNEDLSAFYFDIRKDRLYCDAPDDPGRRAYRTVLDTLFQALIRYAAPVLVFTAEEVWQSRYPGAESVHLLEWPEVPAATADSGSWRKLRELRERVTEAIEPLRREKVVRSGLEAEVSVPDDMIPDGFSDAGLAEVFITGEVSRGGDALFVRKSDEAKCGRCWRLLPDVPEEGALCGRCEDVVAQMDATA